MIIGNFFHKTKGAVLFNVEVWHINDAEVRKGGNTVDKAILAVVFEKEKEEAADILSQTAAQLAGGTKENSQSPADRVRGKQLKVFEVMYNPSSLKYSMEGGRIRYENVQDTGNVEPNLQAVRPEEMSLSFELLIDGAQTRKTINALLGMLSSERNRQVLFTWGSLSFPGEVVSLSSSYSMFDLAGKPVRGKVNMTVRQSSGKEQGQYWQEAFEKLCK